VGTPWPALGPRIGDRRRRDRPVRDRRARPPPRQGFPRARDPPTLAAGGRLALRNVPGGRPRRARGRPRRGRPGPAAPPAAGGARGRVRAAGAGPVLLLGPVGTWRSWWRAALARLAREFRCVCLDAPGTGLSGRADVGGVSLERCSTAVACVIEQLDLRDVT